MHFILYNVHAHATCIKMNKRIGIYLRVSTAGQSTDLQRQEIESYLKARGWEDWQVYEDKLIGTNIRNNLIHIFYHYN